MSAALARGLGALLLGLSTLGLLAACAPERRADIQARSEARGTATPTGRLEDWGFGNRPVTGGFVYNQRGGA